MKIKRKNKGGDGVDRFYLVDAIWKGMDFIFSQMREDGIFPIRVGKNQSLLNAAEFMIENYSSVVVLGCLSRCFTKHGFFFDREKKEKFAYLKNECAELFERKTTVCFFSDFEFPDDIDITSLASSNLIDLGEPKERFKETLEKVSLNYCADKNSFFVYFFDSRELEEGEVKEETRKLRIGDIITDVNAEAFIRKMEKRIPAIEQEIFNFLRLKKYEKSGYSIYYITPMSYIYFAARLAAEVRNNKRWRLLLIVRAWEILFSSIQKEFSPLNISMGISSLILMGEEDVDEIFVNFILSFQDAQTGAWPAEALFHYGRRIGFFGSRVLSTAFAIEALCSCLKKAG
ncbi:MAG: hypothetical protein V1698_01970 [bacterium]